MTVCDRWGGRWWTNAKHGKQGTTLVNRANWLYSINFNFINKILTLISKWKWKNSHSCNDTDICWPWITFQLTTTHQNICLHCTSVCLCMCKTAPLTSPYNPLPPPVPTLLQHSAQNVNKIHSRLISHQWKHEHFIQSRICFTPSGSIYCMSGAILAFILAAPLMYDIRHR